MIRKHSLVMSANTSNVFLNSDRFDAASNYRSVCIPSSKAVVFTVV